MQKQQKEELTKIAIVMAMMGIWGVTIGWCFGASLKAIAVIVALTTFYSGLIGWLILDVPWLNSGRFIHSVDENGNVRSVRKEEKK